MDVSRAHAQAINDLTETAGYPTFLGKVTVPDDQLEYPYLIVWPPPAARRRINLTASEACADTVTQITAVGRDVSEVLAALDRVADRLLGVKPALDGRNPGRIQQVGTPRPPEQSDATRTPEGQPVYRGHSEWRLISTRA